MIDPNYIQEAASVFSLRLCDATSLLKPDAPQQLDEGRRGAQSVKVLANAELARISIVCTQRTTARDTGITGISKVEQ